MSRDSQPKNKRSKGCVYTLGSSGRKKIACYKLPVNVTASRKACLRVRHMIGLWEILWSDSVAGNTNAGDLPGNGIMDELKQGLDRECNYFLENASVIFIWSILMIARFVCAHVCVFEGSLRLIIWGFKITRSLSSSFYTFHIKVNCTW